MNYVYNKVICTKETMEKYFIDFDPFGDGTHLNETYITFNKLLDTGSITASRVTHRFTRIGGITGETIEGRGESKSLQPWLL